MVALEQRATALFHDLAVAVAGGGALCGASPAAQHAASAPAARAELVRATRSLVERGVRHISKDLVWKLWFECAQVEERHGNLLRSRAAYVRSVAACPPNLRWKVWLGGARTELAHRHFGTSVALLERAYAEAPPKNRALVMLEQSRLHELTGDAGTARTLLREARITARNHLTYDLPLDMCDML